MKKKYLAPQMKAYIVEETEILAGSETLTVIDNPNKAVSGMLSKDLFGFGIVAEEE